MLKSGIASLNIDLDETQQQALLRYHGLFQKWNRTYNLSAIRDPLDSVRLHLLDSLSIAPFLSGVYFADVGTGGGLPGIPLAICFPERQFTLIDSAGKKTRFLTQVKQELSLENVDVQNLRVEDWQPEPKLDGVISRAFASLQDMTHWCAHLLASNGAFYAMKGQLPSDELSQIEKHYIVAETHQLSVPGVDAERCLLILRERV